jgi:hypothetical protein
MAEELLKGPARDDDAIERADRMISRLHPDVEEIVQPAVGAMAGREGRRRWMTCRDHDPRGNLASQQSRTIVIRAGVRVAHLVARVRSPITGWRRAVGRGAAANLPKGFRPQVRRRERISAQRRSASARGVPCALLAKPLRSGRFRDVTRTWRSRVDAAKGFGVRCGRRFSSRK